MSQSTTKFIRTMVPGVAWIGLTITAGNAYGFSGGVDGYSGAPGDGPDCTQAACHVIETPPIAVPMVTITGPIDVIAGSMNNYTISVEGGPGMTAGIDVAASDGMLAVPAGNTDVKDLNGEIVHAAPMTMTGGVATFAFDWTAPAVNGTYHIYGAGLSSDDGATAPGVSSDGTGLAMVTINVTGAANQPPMANITAPATAAEGVNVTFDGSGSTDADGSIATYEWDFGDGTTGAGMTVSNAFAAGTYTVQLTVTDDAGATGMIGANITIIPTGQPVPPTANAGGPYSGTVGAPVSFDGSASSDPDGTIMSYSWDFGDGNTAAGMQVSNTFASPGPYAVTLTVTDDAGMSAQGVTTATVTPAVSDPAPGGGEALYVALCESCHGPNGVGGPDGDVVGASATAILDAGVAYPVEMGFVSAMPEADIIAIADFLNPTADVGEGATLYTAMCESCHGPNGVGGPDGDVVGESAEDILEAGEEYPVEMGFVLTLPEEQVAAMGAFLISLAEVEEEEDDDAAPAEVGGNPAPRPSSGGNNRGGSRAGGTTSTTSTPEKSSAGGGAVDAAFLVLIGAAAWMGAGCGRRRRPRMG